MTKGFKKPEELLLDIAEHISTHGFCHYSEVVFYADDLMALVALERDLLVESGLCPHCRKARELVLTEAGRARVWNISNAPRVSETL